MTTYPRFAVLVLALLALAASACQLPPFLPEFQVNTSDPGYNFSNDVAMGEARRFHRDLERVLDGRRSLRSRLRRLDRAVRRTVSREREHGARPPRHRRSPATRRADSSSSGPKTTTPRSGASAGTPTGRLWEATSRSIRPTGTVSRPHVASDASGNFVVTWTSDVQPNMQAVARRFDHNGAPLGDEFTVSAYTTGDQSPSGIAMSPTGFVVTWFGEGAAGDGVFHRMFDDTGAPSTGDFQVNTDTVIDDYLHPDVAMNAAGDFVVVWDDTVGLFSGVMGRRFDSTGASLGDVFPISGTSLAAVDPRVASDSAGNFVVTWSSAPVLLGEGGTNDNSAVRARLYDVGGSAVSVEFVVNEITTAVSVSRAPFTRPRRLVRRRLQQRNELRIQRERAQERSPRGAGDHGRPAARSGLRTHGRQQPQPGIRTRRNGHRSLRLGQRHRRRRRRGGRSERTVTALHRPSGCGLHARG